MFIILSEWNPARVFMLSLWISGRSFEPEITAIAHGNATTFLKKTLMGKLKVPVKTRHCFTGDLAKCLSKLLHQ